jgi:hypothetical protein
MALVVVCALATPRAAPARVVPPGGQVKSPVSKPCTIVGTQTADNLKGTRRDDVICGRGGNDRIHGGNGDDVIRGGPGADRLFGDYGDDFVYGGPGNDLIEVGPGEDFIFPGGGSNTCSYVHGGRTYRSECGLKRRHRGLGADDCCYGTRVDQTPPKLGPVKVTPTVIDASSGGRSVQVSVVALDDESGVGSVVLTFSGPGGQWRELDLGGASRAGGVTLTDFVPVPASTPSGEYEITSVRVADKAGNATTFDSSGLESIEGQAAYGALRFSVYHGPDQEAPNLAGIQLPKSVNTDGAPADVHYSVEVTDDLSGVVAANVSFGLPGHPDDLHAPLAELETGTAHDGFWSGALSLPRYATPGTYQVKQVSLRDYAGNTRTYTADELETLGFAAELEVLGSGDSTPPEILHFQVDTPTTGGPDGSPSYAVHWEVRDDLSGIGEFGDSYFGHLGFWVQGPNGNGIGGSGTNPALLIGTGLDGIWVATWQLPSGSPSGEYRVTAVEATDRAGNQTILSGSELEATGWDLTWENLP